MKPILLPPINYNKELSTTDNIFRNKFGHCTDDEWGNILLQSLKETAIQEIEFPSFPDEDLQSGVHGNSGEVGVKEAMDFYKFVKNNTYRNREISKKMTILDFGSGWGRIIRPFMLDFDLKNLYGFEPNFLLCCMARSLNPYCCFLTGTHIPNNYIPADSYDLVVGWSIFSHLSESSAKSWLVEMAKVIRVGGWCVLTTWGERFLNRLQREQNEMETKDIHWYSRVCIEAAGGDLQTRLDAYRQGEFVWFTGGQSTLYGEAFLGAICLERWIRELGLPFRLKLFDSNSLSQDAFILQKI